MRRWLWLVVPLLVVALASLAIACDDDEEEGAPAGETPAAEEETPAAEAGRLVADIQPFGADSTASGIAVLTETADGTTQVEVEVTGLPEGPHANHIHHGTCDAQGEIHVTLEVLEAGADGTASGTTTDFQDTDPDPEFSHFAQGHYYAVHAGGGDVIGCGDVVEG